MMPGGHAFPIDRFHSTVLIRRRLFLAGGLASFALIRHASAAPPATIADGTTIGRGKMLVVHEDASGRILAFDSSTYLEDNPTGGNDVVAIGSYCGTRVLAPIFSRGVKAVIATDAGIGLDEAGISGLKHGEQIGVPVASIAAMSAETSNGRSTLLGEISRVNAQARALGVTLGMVAYEAAARLAKAPAGRSIPTQMGAEEMPVVVEETARGRIWATPARPPSRRRSRTTSSAAARIRAASCRTVRCAWRRRAPSPTTPASPRTTARSRAWRS